MTRKRKLMRRTASGLAVIAAAGLCASGLGTPIAVAQQNYRPTNGQYQQGTVPPSPSGGQQRSASQIPSQQTQTAPDPELVEERPGPVRAALTGFVDRVGRVFRRDTANTRNGPPVDPGGFSYPTASNPNLGRSPNSVGTNQPLPGAIGGADIPAIPPNVNPGRPRVPGVASSKPQPGLFLAPDTATPIADGGPSTNTTIVEAPIPPLEPLTVPDPNVVTPAPAEPAQVAQGSDVPEMAPSAADIPSLPPIVSADEAPANPTAAPAKVASLPADAPTAKPAQDPFANLFPADRESAGSAGESPPVDMPAKDVAAATTEPATVPMPADESAPAVAKDDPETPPFTGVALEADLIEQARTASPPATMPNVAAPADPSAEPASPGEAVAQQPAPTSTVPSLDLSLPSDMPKLPPIEVPAAQPQQIPAEFPAMTGNEPAPVETPAAPASVATPPEFPNPSETPPAPLDAPTTAEAKPAPLEIPMTADAKPAPLEVPMATESKPIPVETPRTEVAEKPSAPASTPQDDTVGPSTSPPKNEHQSKMERIAARNGRTGFKGFCPVVLRDERDLVDGVEEHTAEFDGREYVLSSRAALEVFLGDPERYAPAAQGYDVIHQALTGEKIDGLLDHAVWYRDRLYLFSTVETMETFVAAPSSHAVE